MRLLRSDGSTRLSTSSTASQSTASSLSSDWRTLSDNDLVLSPESNMKELEATLKSEGIDAVPIKESSVGRKKVYVLRVL